MLYGGRRPLTLETPPAAWAIGRVAGRNLRGIV